MKILRRFLESSLGKKYIMALTGLALVVFVVGHLLGNLQIFLGPELINRYGHFLQSSPELIWPARLGLLAMAVFHVWAAVTLSRLNRAARPVGYSDAYKPVAASYASRTMLMSGLIIAAFILYHLLHFTVQVPTINFAGRDFHALIDSKQRHDVYAMMVLGFQRPLVAGFYVLAIGLLCLHLSHGIGSVFQSLGLKSKGWASAIDHAGRVIAWAIFLGYISIPIAVLAGLGATYVKEVVK